MAVKRPARNRTPEAPKAADSASARPTGFPIVGIGASAGGLSAFEAFFSAMPSNTESGIAIVLVQHLSPDHKSILVELVKRYTRMQVFEVEDGMRVQPNCAYIIPPNRNMSLTDSMLSLTEPAEPRGLRLRSTSSSARSPQRTTNARSASSCPARAATARWGSEPSRARAGW